MKKKKYVITRKGSIVQEYNSFLDFLIKRYDLEPFINFWLNFLDFILLQIKSSQMMRDLLNFYQQILAYIEKILNFFTPEPTPQLARP